jgi:hypothetical protein
VGWLTGSLDDQCGRIRAPRLPGSSSEGRVPRIDINRAIQNIWNALIYRAPTGINSWKRYVSFHGFPGNGVFMDAGVQVNEKIQRVT